MTASALQKGAADAMRKRLRLKPEELVNLPPAKQRNGLAALRHILP